MIDVREYRITDYFDVNRIIKEAFNVEKANVSGKRTKAKSSRGAKAGKDEAGNLKRQGKVKDRRKKSGKVRKNGDKY